MWMNVNTAKEMTINALIQDLNDEEFQAFRQINQDIQVKALLGSTDLSVALKCRPYHIQRILIMQGFYIDEGESVSYSNERIYKFMISWG